MRILMAALGLFLFLVAVGCGGGNANGKGTASGNLNIAGNWKIVLAENQSAAPNFGGIGDSNNTRIAIAFTQSGSIITTNTNEEIWAGNVGCEANGGSFWWNGGSWLSQEFTLESGAQVSGRTVSFALREGQLGTHSASADLSFIGTVQNDGSISGTLTDGCIFTNGLPTKNVAWTATKLATFPPTSWP